MKMKLIAGLIFVIISAAFALDSNKFDLQSAMDKLIELRNSCLAETKATEADVKDIANSKIPSTHEGKCLVFCYSKNFGFQDPDGKFNKEKALEELDEIKEEKELHALFKDVILNCMDSVKENSDPCITASELFACISKRMEELK
nr:odorant-binding protein [Lasioderma serricorne]